MWLTGRLIPDHKTIADFRKDSGPAIKQVWSAHDHQRRDRWQQVQGRQYPRQELHEWKGGATPCTIGEERGALSCAARHCGPTRAIGRPSGEDRAFEGEAGQAGKRDAAASNDGEADASVTRSADLAHRSRQPLDGDHDARDHSLRTRHGGYEATEPIQWRTWFLSGWCRVRPPPPFRWQESQKIEKSMPLPHTFRFAFA
jgi:hypothetical protein